VCVRVSVTDRGLCVSVCDRERERGNMRDTKKYFFVF